MPFAEKIEKSITYLNTFASLSADGAYRQARGGTKEGLRAARHNEGRAEGFAVVADALKTARCFDEVLEMIGYFGTRRKNTPRDPKVAGLWEAYNEAADYLTRTFAEPHVAALAS